jgi:hypothetical protein
MLLCMPCVLLQHMSCHDGGSLPAVCDIASAGECVSLATSWWAVLLLLWPLCMCATHLISAQACTLWYWTQGVRKPVMHAAQSHSTLVGGSTKYSLVSSLRITRRLQLLSVQAQQSKITKEMLTLVILF